MKQAKRFISNHYTLITLGILFVLAIWSLVSFKDGNGTFLFPSPFDTFKSLGELLKSSYTYKSIGWTLLRTFLGFLISLVLALFLGLIAGNYKNLQTFFKPLIIVFKAVPTAAFVYLFLARNGSRWAPMYIVMLVSFPIIYEAIIGGMNSIEDEILDQIKIDCLDPFTPLFKIKLPLTFPFLVIGMTSSFALSIKTEIMAEIITGDTNYGLGAMISAYRNLDPTDLSPIFAIALIAIIIVLIITLIAHLIEIRIKRNIQ